MTPRGRVLVIGLMLGLIAAILVYTAVKRSADMRLVGRMKTVLVAKTDIDSRTELQAGMLQAVKLPEKGLRSDAIENPRDAVGKVTTIRILTGEPILASKLADKGTSMGLAFAIEPSKRAVTVATNDVSGISGFVKPGDRVDVLATFSGSYSSNGATVTRTVLQNVTVLATGKTLRDEKSTGNPSKSVEIPTVTLLVTPEEAERLVLADDQGKIRLALRPNDDIAWIPIDGVRLAALTGISDRIVSRSSAPSRSPASVRAAEKPHSVRVREDPVTVSPAVGFSIPSGQSLQPVHTYTGPSIEVIRGTQRETTSLPSGRNL